ncbi:MAG TPA: hypothetical protein VLD57_05950, partial [Blastocatellia bacterium]|nr:hypothetical protein [Blastocatellia bacterium]
MKRKRIIALLSILFCCTVFPETHEAQRKARAPRSKTIDDAALRSVDSRPGDWLTHGRNYAETRFSPLNQINASNV